MKQIKEEIELHMRSLSDLYFSSKPMREYAHLFIAEKLKEPMVFGALTVWHYRLFGGKGDEIQRIAAGIELLILSSDILDDLQDQDAPAKPWMQIPEPEAMNVVMGLLLIGQQAIIHGAAEADIRLQASELVQEKLLCSLNGQMTDIRNEMQDIEHYVEMTKEKSASLFVMSCGLGALYSRGRRHPAVEEYAEYMGLSAQLSNDCKDLFNWGEKNDFTARKRTLPMLYLLDSVEGPDLWVKDYIEKGTFPAEMEINESLFKDLCERYGVVLYSQVQIQVYFYEFMERFAAVPETAGKKEEFLREFAVRVEPNSIQIN